MNVVGFVKSYKTRPPTTGGRGVEEGGRKRERGEGGEEGEPFFIRHMVF